MNQSIQVLDGCSWCEKSQGMLIQVMVGGFITECLITGVSEKDMNLRYQQMQFDIEEHLLQQLQDHELETGEIYSCHLNEIAI